ncbi:hypothetical protein SpCBS45565_g01420 [Spizellomyces sp. 'palustris']|nr:hypothetical protein SpCBS45565_g01420 [Spizellomyces sp. 'palustris']
MSSPFPTDVAGDEFLPPAKRVRLVEDENISPRELELGSDVLPHVEIEAENDAGEQETDMVKAERQLVGSTYGHLEDKVASGGGGAFEEARDPAQPVVFALSEKTKQIMQDEARHLGFWDWLEKYSALPLSFLFDVFDFSLPEHLRQASDDDLLPLLKSVMMKKVEKRSKRPDINTLEQAIELLRTCKNIMVLTGAGVSVSCGIPDFRSKNGIYSRLDEFELDDPQQMFDIEYFRIQPQTFYSFAREIYPSNFKPSPSHLFIKLLEEKGKLLRNYTQNIDTLEQVAGIKRVVQCHGSFATAKCIVCGYKVPGDALEKDIFQKQVPMCPVCGEERDGIMKPDITFFGEMLPDEFDRLFAEDKEKVDLLIVMGSSLKVSPVADVKDKIPHHVPQILINMESLPHMEGFDIHLLGYCDTICAQLCRMLEWDLKHEKLPGGSSLSLNETVDQAGPDHDRNRGAQEDGSCFRQGRQPHHYLFEGAIGLADMDPAAYIPSDREDTSATSSDDETRPPEDSEDSDADVRVDVSHKIDAELKGEGNETGPNSFPKEINTVDRAESTS